jgi:hypothetical protein
LNTGLACSALPQSRLAAPLRVASGDARKTQPWLSNRGKNRHSLHLKIEKISGISRKSGIGGGSARIKLKRISRRATDQNAITAKNYLQSFIDYCMSLAI